MHIMAADPRLVRAASRTATPPQPPPPPPVELMHDSRPPPGPNTAEAGVVGDTRPKEDGGFKLKFCTVCASNQNR